MESNIEKWIAKVLASVDALCKEAGIDFFIIGAIARDLWLAEHGKSTGRVTRDLDLALYVQTVKQFESVKGAISNLPGYSIVSDNPLRIVAANRYAIDILPFCDIDNSLSESSIVTQVGVEMKLAGFTESYHNGTVQRSIRGASYAALTMPALILLKLNAIGAKPEQRLLKDLNDILSVLSVYGDIEYRALLDGYDDLWEEELTLKDVAILALGRNILYLIKNNPLLIRSTRETLAFISNIDAKRLRNAGGKFGSVEELRKWLNLLMRGFK